MVMKAMVLMWGWLYNTFDVAPDGDDDCDKL